MFPPFAVPPLTGQYDDPPETRRARLDEAVQKILETWPDAAQALLYRTLHAAGHRIGPALDARIRTLKEGA